MKRFSILVITFLTLLAGCTPNEKANINDLQMLSGIRDHKLILGGAEGASSTFTFRANHDWTIVDYKGFRCTPSSGARNAEGEISTVTATTLQANNSADTIRLSELNFKLLSTRFVGISAYQLPQIILSDGSRIPLNASKGSTASLTFISSSDDVELVAEGDITTSLSKKSSKNEYTITVTATEDNLESEDRIIGTIGFSVDGVMQESKVEVTQISAIVLDRSEVILPSKGGGQNIFVVDSDFEVETSSIGTESFLISRNGNTFTVTAMRDNNGSDMSLLGEVEIYLKDAPDCKTTITIKQRSGKAPQSVIFHFIGTALQHYYNHNIEKIIAGLSNDIQGEAQVLILTTDSTNDATLYELRYDKILGKAVKEKIKELSLPTPYNSALFQKNLKEAIDFAPAERYALVIGSHGLGWVQKYPYEPLPSSLQRLGFNRNTLWERNQDAEMTRHLGDKGEVVEYDINEIADAIEANNIKLDYILFDACFMSNVESAYELRNATNYIIGSPCEVMGYGFPYANIMQYMFEDGGTSYDLDKICREYVRYYKEEATTSSACVALTKTDELEALAQAMKAVNQAGIRDDFSLAKVQYYEGQNPHSFYDLGHMVELSCADATVAAAFKKQLAKTVTSLYHTDRFYSAYGSNSTYYHDINYYSGISTSAMVEHYEYDWKNYTEWYPATH